MLKWLAILLFLTIAAGIVAFTGVVAPGHALTIARIVFAALIVIFIICIFIYVSTCDDDGN